VTAQRMVEVMATPALRGRWLCTQAGQEEFFALVGDKVPSRTAPPPRLTEEDQEERKKRVEALAQSTAPSIYAEGRVAPQPQVATSGHG
jgi:hypothetical protein